MNKPAILIVTLRYEIDGDLEVAKQKLRHAYAPREGRVESISSSGEYGNVLATCISMQAGIQEEQQCVARNANNTLISSVRTFCVSLKDAQQIVPTVKRC